MLRRHCVWCVDGSGSRLLAVLRVRGTTRACATHVVPASAAAAAATTNAAARAMHADAHTHMAAVPMAPQRVHGSKDDVSDDKSHDKSPVPQATDSVREALLRDHVVHPFTGKLLSVHAPLYAELVQLGFQRSTHNRLQLQWNVQAYMERYYKIMQQLQQRRGSTHELADGDGDKNSDDKSNKDSATDMTTRVLDVMLRTFERHDAPRWRVQLARLLRRPDAATAVTEALTQRYAQLVQAYMPPKLDASPDTTLADAMLTVDQQHAVQIALRGYSMYIGGRAGTGKTVLLKALFHRLSQMGLRVAMTATTGVAAVQLGGCTFHHAFAVPFDDVTGQPCDAQLRRRQRRRRQQEQQQEQQQQEQVTMPMTTTTVAAVAHMPTTRWDANALRAVDVVVLDEVSLLSAQALDAFDAEAQLARLDTSPFGGIQLIACGDFMQLSNNVEADVLPAYRSHCFAHLVAVRLVTPMRHTSNDALLHMLDELRHGRYQASTMAALDRPLPPQTTHVTYIFPRRREAYALNRDKLAELQTAAETFVPQRGPLRLMGTFTSSAVLELPCELASGGGGGGCSLAAGTRARVVAAVRAALAQHLPSLISARAQRKGDDKDKEKDKKNKDNSDDNSDDEDEDEDEDAVRVLPDHDCVVMPVRNPHLVVPSFGHDDNSDSNNNNSNNNNNNNNNNNSNDNSNADDRHTQLVFVRLRFADAQRLRSGRSATMTTTAEQQQQQQQATPCTLSAATLSEELDEARWATVAQTAAARLGARLRTMLRSEPQGCIPLAVTMSLADMSDSDTVDCMAPLPLKLGCRVMITRNLSRTVSNGSVGVVESFDTPESHLMPRRTDMSRRGVLYSRHVQPQRAFARLPVVRLLSGEVLQIPPLTVAVGGTAQTYYYGHEVYTLPLQLGYAFTVHKVQGLTLHGTVVVDCAHFFPCPHLIYVACSRVRSLDQLIVRNITADMVTVDKDALAFSEQVREARDPCTLVARHDVARAAWTRRVAPRILQLQQ